MLNTKPRHVGFVVDQVAQGQIFFKYFVFLMLLYTHHCEISLNRMLGNPDRNTTNEKCCFHFSTHFKRRMSLRKADELLLHSRKV
jgi:hypothetical protein